MWRNYDENAEVVEEPETTDDGALKTEYQDIIISDVRTTNGLVFSVQILNTEGMFHPFCPTSSVCSLLASGIASLEKLMRDFSLHYRAVGPSPAGFVPKGGDLVSAKFSDGAWYRAKIRRASAIKYVTVMVSSFCPIVSDLFHAGKRLRVRIQSYFAAVY